MGRGLSDIQKEILRLAWRKRTRGNDSRKCDLYQSEILEELCGWNPTKYVSAKGQIFSRREIGKSRYNSTRATLSRAIRRLHQRGLVTWTWSGINLTAEGVRTVEKEK